MKYRGKCPHCGKVFTLRPKVVEEPKPAKHEMASHLREWIDSLFKR